MSQRCRLRRGETVHRPRTAPRPRPRRQVPPGQPALGVDQYGTAELVADLRDEPVPNEMEEFIEQCGLRQLSFTTIKYTDACY